MGAKMAQLIDGIELLPCPFCGNPFLSMGKTELGWQAIQCDECGTLGPSVELERIKIIRRWNTRTLQPKDEDEAE